MFIRCIGIDYSGAETPTSSLKGLRVYLADDEAPPVEVLLPPSLRKYWTRKCIAEWRRGVPKKEHLQTPELMNGQTRKRISGLGKPSTMAGL
jgi:hypothetical protein